MKVNARAIVLIAVGAMALQALADAAPRKRSIDLEITLPNGAAPRVMVPEGEGAIVRLPDRTGFGFVPTIRDGEQASIVAVAIWDVDTVPNRRLGDVEVKVGAPSVASDTTPSFAIRVVRVVKPK